MVKVCIENPVTCKTDKAGRMELAPCLRFETTWWKKTSYRMKEMRSFKSLISRKGEFLAGLIPRVVNYCKLKNIPLELYGWDLNKPRFEADEKNLGKFLKQVKKFLGKDFRQEQLDLQEKLIRLAIEHQRGVLLSPTGTGKTNLALGIASSFPKTKLLYLCHTKAIVVQTAAEFKKFGFKTTRILEGHKDQSGNIVVATRQSIINIPEGELKKYGILMIDEIHHFSDTDDCEYAQISRRIMAPMRFGFTAKLTGKPRADLASEGHIGPVIGELTMDKAEEMGILAKTKLRIVCVPKQFLENNTYDNVHDEAIVNSRVRNRLIVSIAEEYIKQGMSVLIFVTQVAHLENLINIAKTLHGFKIVGVTSSGKYATNADEKEQIKKDFQNKKFLCAVTTSVWNEGINIPSLNVAILADVGKKDYKVLQVVGRGKRKTNEKSEMVVVDFFDDCSTHLIKQFGYRIAFYSECGWL